MTITFRVDDEAPEDLLAATELFLNEAAQELVRAIRRSKAKPGEEAKTATQAVKDFKSAFDNIMAERTRVEKLHKDTIGAVGDHAFNFDAARDEIGRRLACLRDAGGGG